MTDTAELIAKLLNGIGAEFDDELHLSGSEARQIADALSSLVRERDKARAEVARLERELDDADEDACELENDYALERSRATAAEAELTRLRAENEKMREALEPSAATKAAYIGEFMIAVERIVNEDEEPVDDGADAPDPYDHIQVPWTTIKQIMAAIRARASLSNTSEGGERNGD